MKNNHLGLLFAGLVFAGAMWCEAAVPPATPQGLITEKVFLDIGSGSAVTDLTGNPKFPDHADVIRYPSYFELHATGDIGNLPPGDVYNSFGSQMVGYFYPPADGDYVFYLCADDNSDLYLSIDEHAANKRLIAQETSWSPNRAYDSSYSSDVTAKNSATFAGTQWPVLEAGRAKITLAAGKAYYIEALQKDGAGGDNLSVAMAIVDENGSWIVPSLPIRGEYLSSVDRNSGPLVIVSAPQSQNVEEGRSVTFSMVVDGTPPYAYLWKRDGLIIPGATSSSYTIDAVSLADDATVFTIVVTGGEGEDQSASALLTVFPDTTPPTLVSAVGSPSLTTVTITFSEPLDPATAQVAGNYHIDGLDVLLATPSPVPDNNVVVLLTSRQAAGTLYTASVENVKDLFGNSIAAASTILFRSYIFQAGIATYERWLNGNGDPGNIEQFAESIANGTIREPDYRSTVNQFGAPWNVGDNYSARVYAWFIPPSDGNYVFFVATDDQSRLYLSIDENPANKRLIAQETGWSSQYEWSGGVSDPVGKRSDWYYGTITLEGGKPYYMELLHDQGNGGNGSDATFIKEDEPLPASDVSGMHLLGNVIVSYAPPMPAAIAKATPNPAEVAQLVQLDGSMSYHQDPARQIIRWEWDLDNDGNFDVDGSSATATFTAQGIYTVTLRITDDSSPPKTAQTTLDVVVANKLVPWQGKGTGELIFDYDSAGAVASVMVQETGVATHVGKYTETVLLTSPTTGIVEITAADGDRLFGDLVHLSPIEVQVTITGGTGRFDGARGRYVGTLTMTSPTTFTATATGVISSVGLSKK